MGVNLTIEGRKPQLTNYSIQADVVSHNPADTGAGVGGTSVSMPLESSGLEDIWPTLYGSSVNIIDGTRGNTSVVTSMSLNDYDTLDLSAEGPLRALMATVLLKPFAGTVRKCVTHFISSVDPSLTVTFENVSTTDTATVPAYYGSIWPYFREFLTVQRLEIVASSLTSFTVRKMDSNTTVHYDQISTQPSPTARGIVGQGDQVAEKVQINWYKNEYITNGTVYPVVGEDPSVISVNAGEVAIVELKTKTGMSSVNNPTAVDWLGAEYTGEGTTGAYTIAGDDGNRVAASSWTAAGGNVTANIKPDDPYTIILTVTAPTNGILATVNSANTAAPYHLAMTDGNLYSRLFITGTGVRTEENNIVLDTGADTLNTEKGIGFTLDNKHVGSLSQAYDVGIRVAQACSGIRISTSRSAATPVQDSFTATQGALFKTPDRNYRIQSATYSPTGVSFEAVQHTTFADFNSRWSGKKFSDFNASWTAQEKHRMLDFGVLPLR